MTFSYLSTKFIPIDTHSHTLFCRFCLQCYYKILPHMWIPLYITYITYAHTHTHKSSSSDSNVINFVALHKNTPLHFVSSPSLTPRATKCPYMTRVVVIVCVCVCILLLYSHKIILQTSRTRLFTTWEFLVIKCSGWGVVRSCAFVCEVWKKEKKVISFYNFNRSEIETSDKKSSLI